MLNKELSRKTFVKGGGAMIVGFSVLAAGFAGKAHADSPFPPWDDNARFPANQLDGWIQIHADNTASILTGRIEMGQGSSTALLQIAGEELDLTMKQMRFVRNETNVTPNTGQTSASNTITNVGPLVRKAAAAARQALLGLASASLSVPVAALSVSEGVVSGGGKSIKYGDLIGDKLFNVAMTGTAPQKSISSYKLVTTRVPRIDIPDKVTGQYAYVQNVHVPGMLHGRVVRPRGQGAYGTDAQILSIDESSIRNIPNVQIVRKGNFLGVVAPHEYDAIQAAAQLKVKWQNTPVLPSSGGIWQQMRAHDAAGQAPARYLANTGNVDTALASAARTVSATYTFHYNGHMPIGPTCVVADVKPGSAVVLSNSQSSYGLRTDLAPLLGLPEKSIRVQYWEGSSGYGSGAPYADAAMAAALMSQIVGKPVRLQFMRWDEHGWDNYNPAQLMDMRGGVDAAGNLIAYDYTSFSIPFMVKGQGDTTRQLVGESFPTPPLGGANNASTNYNVTNRRVTVKSLPLKGNYFKANYLRTVLAIPTYFGSEQMIDELAYAAKMDPLAFRMKNIATDPAGRWTGIANALQSISNWQPRVAGSNLSSAKVVTGRGIAFVFSGGSYAGTVADVDVDKKTGKITVKHLYVAFDGGLTINPALVENQMVGGNIQAVSRLLSEEVGFDKNRVTSLDWVSYPVLRFKDHPSVTTAVVQRTDQAPGGAGEPAMEPTPAAVANAFFDATGVRIREAPLTPGRVRATLKAAGVK
jgi:CO/xanthine dehydrogenase Mo-binding subunit